MNKRIIEDTVYIIATILSLPVWLLVANNLFYSQDEKFNAVPLHTSVNTLEEDWGKADRMLNDGRDVYFYDADMFGWFEYVFVFEKGKLTFKTIED